MSQGRPWWPVAVCCARIVEIAATQGHASAHLPGGSYAEVVCVPQEIRETPGALAAARVHGIPDDEIANGTPFPEAWGRFLAFAEAALNDAIHESSGESDDEGPSPPRPLDDLCAHNGAVMLPPYPCHPFHACTVILTDPIPGVRFDFAVLLFECS